MDAYTHYVLGVSSCSIEDKNLRNSVSFLEFFPTTGAGINVYSLVFYFLCDDVSHFLLRTALPGFV